MNRQEILLTEYEVCQQAINANASRYWTIIGIFVPVSTGVLAWVINIIISNSIPINENAKWLVLVFGVGIIIILALLWFWLRRVNFFISISYFRMREIENELGMLKNLTVEWVDHPDGVPDEQRERINEIRRRYPSPPIRETTSFILIFSLISVMWIVFIVLAFTVFNC